METLKSRILAPAVAHFGSDRVVQAWKGAPNPRTLMWYIAYRIHYCHVPKDVTLLRTYENELLTRDYLSGLERSGELARRADWTVLGLLQTVRGWIGGGWRVELLIMSRTSFDSGVWLRVLMDSQSTPNDQLPADPGLTAEEDATIDGGGNNVVGPEDIVDDVLTDLPVPSRHHVFEDDLGADIP